MDIGLYETLNGGDIVIQDGDIYTTAALWTQIYLALFGGAVEQTSTEIVAEGEQRADWWGNAFLTSDEEEQLNSTTEKTLNTTALNSSGRLAIQRAVEQDLRYLSKLGRVVVEVTLPGIDRVAIQIGITETGKEEQRFKLIWSATKRNPLSTGEESAAGGITGLWILRNGIWDDLGKWFDSEYWRDF
jgi:phage gp46-like protein